MIYQCTEENFLKDVSAHQVTILHEDGLNRHVRFCKPDSSDMLFDLITWPGSLCYTGDMGTYVFRRLEDMFEFFRTDRECNRSRGRELGINLSYWAEKLEAVDRSGSSGSYQEFSEDRFTRAVIGDLIQWIRSNAYRTTKDERRELWIAVTQDVIGADGDSGGYRKQAAAHDFNHHINHDVGDFYFQDFWDHDVTEYTQRFVWCCYALAWGIQQYDSAKEKKAADQEFYLQESRDYVGNDVLWWAEAGGYTTDLNKAEIFTKESAYRQNKMRETDIPWPKGYIESKSRPAVDMQYINPTVEMLNARGVTA